MELIILGSSAAIPVQERNLPAIALKYKNELIIFDCGEDIQRGIINAGLKFNKPLKILISHFHGDHIIGLPGLLFRFGLIDRNAPLSIFGPPNLFLYLFIHKKILGLKAAYPLRIFEIHHDNNKLTMFDGLESDQAQSEIRIKNNIIFEDDKYLLTYGYSFIEKPRNGKFNPVRAKELGIPESKIWKKLHEGQTIEFQGKKIDPLKEGIVGPKRSGRKITYSGDTALSENLIELGKNSDILIHEATFSKSLADVAIEKKHSTSVDAANSAVKMDAKQLILTHISSRYQEDAVELLNEAKEIFPNSLLAKDLLRIELK
jgi:ribonuclease Z